MKGRHAMWHLMRRECCAGVLFVVLLTVGWPLASGRSAHALAPLVVTLCDRDDQAGAGLNLNQALQQAASGGQIAFNCKPFATLQITTTKLLQKDLSIDGLSNSAPMMFIHAIPGAAPGILPLFQTLPGVSLELVDLHFFGNLQSVPPNSALPGGVVSQGTLRAINVSFDGFYDALSVERGRLLLRNSTFTNNNLSLLCAMA